MKNYIYSGKSITVEMEGPVESGSVLCIGDSIGVISSNIKVGEKRNTELYLIGVFELPKDSTSLIQGKKVFYDFDSKMVTASETDKTKLLGTSTENYDGAHTLARIKLIGVPL